MFACRPKCGLQAYEYEECKGITKFYLITFMMIFFLLILFLEQLCPDDMTYSQCAFACRPQCGLPAQYYEREECQECVPGCVCKQG